MPFLHFVDKELIDEISKIKKESNNEDNVLEEHQFIANCLHIGLKIEDLKQMQYKDVAKIMLCFINENKNKDIKNATQNDIDKFLR